MVNDENSGILKFLSGLHVVTGFIEGASFAGAVAVFSTYGRPDFGIGLFFEFLKGSISDAVIIGCLDKGFKLTCFCNYRKGLRLCGRVGGGVSKDSWSGLYKNGFKLGSKNGLNARYVFMKKLFLEGDGIGGDNAACIAFEGGEEGGDQVGITFPNTGSGFYGEVMG